MKFQALVLNHIKGDLANKRNVLEAIADAVTRLQPELTNNEVTQNLLQRERLGSTYIGHGIALPHAKINGLTEPCFILLQLNKALSCDELKEQIDSFLALLIPATEHEEYCQLLSELVAELKNPTSCQKIRRCYTNKQLIQFVEGLPVCSTVN